MTQQIFSTDIKESLKDYHNKHSVIFFSETKTISLLILLYSLSRKLKHSTERNANSHTLFTLTFFQHFKYQYEVCTVASVVGHETSIWSHIQISVYGPCPKVHHCTIYQYLYISLFHSRLSWQ